MDQVVPLSNAPNQTMAVNLTVDNEPLLLQLTFRYSEIIQYWVMDIADGDTNPILTNIPLVTGVFPAANILGQYQYLNIGSAYILDVSNDDNRDYPNSVDIGTSFILLWGDNVN